MGYGTERYGQSYYGVEYTDLVCDALVLNEEIRDALSGLDPRPLQCFVNVTVGGVAVPKVQSVEISRGLQDNYGKAKLEILIDPDAIPASIVPNAEVIITAGVKFKAYSSSQQVFLGNLDSWTAPNPGEVVGIIEAFDGGKRLDEATVTGNMTGDVAGWIAGQCDALSLGTNFAVIQQGDPVSVPEHALGEFRSLLEAAVALLSAYKLQYLAFTGANELLLLDPTSIADLTPLFDLTRAIEFHAITDTSKRYNRVPYSNYTGFAEANMPGYMFLVREDGSFTVSSGNAPGIVQISGTYDDLADQAIYGVLELSGGVQNNICTSDAELLAYATSVATESQRDKRYAQVRFNPFLELGDVVTYQTGTYFVARLQHNMNPDELWTTTVELWGVA